MVDPHFPHAADADFCAHRFALFVSSRASGCGRRHLVCYAARYDDCPRRLWRVSAGVFALHFLLSDLFAASSYRPRVCGHSDERRAGRPRFWNAGRRHNEREHAPRHRRTRLPGADACWHLYRTRKTATDSSNCIIAGAAGAGGGQPRVRWNSRMKPVRASTAAGSTAL